MKKLNNLFSWIWKPRHTAEESKNNAIKAWGESVSNNRH